MDHTTDAMRTVLWWVFAASIAVGAVARFVVGGQPAWLRALVGAGELLAAALLVVPVRRSPLLGRCVRLMIGAGELLTAVRLVAPDRRCQFWGCSLLVVLLVVAVATQVAGTDPIRAWATAPILLALTATLTWRLRDERPRPRWSGSDLQRPAAPAELGELV